MGPFEAVRRGAVAGATGRIGSLTVAELRARGHEAVEISRARGVDLLSGAGLDGVLAGADAVIDTTSTPARETEVAVGFVTTVTANLLAAESRVGVAHHVALSVVGLDNPTTNPHYAGKRAQEGAVMAGPVPWTIVRATQFHDFAAMVVGRTRRDCVATIAPVLVQPIAPGDVAVALVETALGAAQHRRIDVAGPQTQDLVDMARRTLAVRQETVRLVPAWDGPFGISMAGNVLLPGPDARILPTTFDEWLVDQARG